MSTDNPANPRPPASSPESDTLIKPAIVLVALVTLTGGLLRAANFDKWNWDWQTLLFFLAAALILLMPWATKINLSTKGVTFERMPSSVQDLGMGGKKPRTAASSFTFTGPPKPKPRHGSSVPLTNLTLTDQIAGIEHEISSTGSSAQESSTFDESDPQKGRWGGHEVANGRRLSATVTPVTDVPDVFSVRVVVSSTDLTKPLTGEVIFHLHPTFRKDTATVAVENGQAVLVLAAWGAFTIGAECDDGATPLELNLATLPDAPAAFRTR